ncbi:hypothetical protein ACIQD3_01210 [Peribacillus loiseleuriae]|uniref:hypothetical protein n=1 Tax=Peribacillus loiseleuriae TaxID=1679170 RepID=UPI00380EFDEA
MIIVGTSNILTFIISDIKNKRLEFAKENGADYTINPAEVDLESKIYEITNNEGAVHHKHLN